MRGVTYKKWYELYSDPKNKVLNSNIPEELRVKLGETREEIDKRHGASSQDGEEIEMERIPSEILLQFTQDEINELDSEIQKEQDKIINLHQIKNMKRK